MGQCFEAPNGETYKSIGEPQYRPEVGELTAYFAVEARPNCGPRCCGCEECSHGPLVWEAEGDDAVMMAEQFGLTSPLESPQARVLAVALDGGGVGALGDVANDLLLGMARGSIPASDAASLARRYAAYVELHSLKAVEVAA